MEPRENGAQRKWSPEKMDQVANGARRDGADIEKGGCFQPPFPKQARLANLLVVDVHRHFEAEADVIVLWGFPFHDLNPPIRNYE